ncbi:MAG: bifunctional DNA primase/polymerase [Egibacteraceae bacterium]
MRLAALDYAERGLPVFPCHWVVASGGDGWSCSCGQTDCSRRGKHPLARRGHKDASARADVIEGWLRRWPNANIAIPTGIAFDVLDVDGPVGGESLRRFALEHGFSLDGPVVRTGSGWHCLFSPTGSGSRVRLLDHVDYRGAGGYVIAPPSLHATGCHYRWLRPLDLDRLPDLPGAFRELLTRSEPTRLVATPSLGVGQRTGNVPWPASWNGSPKRPWGSAITRSTGRRSAAISSPQVAPSTRMT